MNDTVGVQLMAIKMDATLVPVIVGGLLTVAGGLIGSGITLAVKWFESSQEKKKRRAEKFEEFVRLLFEHRQWLDTMESRVVFGKDEREGLSPLARAEAICSVYFPSARQGLDRLDNAAFTILPTPVCRPAASALRFG
jgi:hypothetical protein